MKINFKLHRIRKKIKNILCHICPVTVTKFLYKKQFNKKLNLKNPKGFNEKLQWIKLNAFNDLVIKCADKYKVREYVKEVGLENILCELYGVYDGIDQIDFDKLPNKFVLKCNHGAGYNIICTDKSTLNIPETKKILQKWLNSDFGYENCEMHYLKMKKLIICEEFLEDSKYDNLIDYKIYCFNGEPNYILVCLDRGTEIKKVFYNLNWKKTPFRKDNADLDIEKPICFDEMLEYAKILSEPFPFVRVDFYNVKNKPIFGELTFTPAGCLSTEYTEQAEEYLGSLINISNLR